jgi:hypothetical protein
MARARVSIGPQLGRAAWAGLWFDDAVTTLQSRINASGGVCIGLPDRRKGRCHDGVHCLADISVPVLKSLQKPGMGGDWAWPARAVRGFGQGRSGSSNPIVAPAGATAWR